MRKSIEAEKNHHNKRDNLFNSVIFKTKKREKNYAEYDYAPDFKCEKSKIAV